MKSPDYIYDDYFYPSNEQPYPPGYAATPRTGTELTPVGGDLAVITSDPSYHENSSYGYGEDIASMTDDLSNTSLYNRPVVHNSTSYDNGSGADFLPSSCKVYPNTCSNH
jgi:hypothetical protein